MYTALSIFTAILVIALSAWHIFGKKTKKEDDLDFRKKTEKTQHEAKSHKKKSTGVKPKKLGGHLKKKKKKDPVPTHEKFSHAIKGHSQPIISFSISPNKKWIATSSTDQSVRITELEDTVNSSAKRIPLFFRININGDTITSLSWAADSLTLVGSSESSREVYFFRMRHKKDNQSNSTSGGFKYEMIELKKRGFSTNHSGIIQSCVIDTAYSRPIIVTGCDTKADDHFYVWDSKSKQKIGQIPNKSCSRGGAVLSGDGHFIANASTNTSEVKIFEVVRKREKGQAEPVFQHVSNKHVMVLASGAHKSSISDVCFGGHDAQVAHGISDRVVTCGTDGFLVLWDIDVRFDLKADPEILAKVNVGSPLKKCAISMNGCKIICVDASDNVHLYQCEAISKSTRALKKLMVIKNDAAIGGSIRKIEFCDYDGLKMVVLNENSKHAFVWHC